MRLSEKLRTILGVAMVCLLLGVPSASIIQEPATPQDEGILVVYPERVLEGDVPNEDFEHLYGPATSWTTAAVFAVTEPSVLAERLVGVVYRLALLLGLFFFLKGRELNPVMGAGVATILVLAEGLSAYPWWAALASAMWAFTIADRLCRRPQTGRRLIAMAGLCGALLSLTVSYRLDLGPGVLVAGLFLLRSFPSTLRRSFVSGFALGLLPILVHLAVIGTDAFMEGLLIDPAIHISPGRRLPITTYDVATVAGFLVAIAGFFLGTFKDRRPVLVVGAFSAFMALSLTHYLQRAEHIHLLYVAVLPLGSVIGLLCSFRLDLSGRKTVAPVALAMITIIFLPQYFIRMDATDYLGPAVFAVSATFTLIAAIEIAKRTPIRRKVLIAGPLTAAFLCSIGTLIAMEDDLRSTLMNAQPSYEVQNRGRSYPLLWEDVAAAANDVLEEFGDVPVGTRLFVGPKDLSRSNYNDTFLYFLMPQAEPATYYLEMNPGSANQDDDLSNQVAEADIAILTDEYDDWSERNESALIGIEKPNEIIERSFCLAARFKPYWVYVRPHSADCDETGGVTGGP